MPRPAARSSASASPPDVASHTLPTRPLTSEEDAMPTDQPGDAVLEGVSIRSLPKVSLHDHLDGGVRPATIIELGDAIGLDVAESDPDALADWISEKSDSGSLVEYLKTFDLTTAVIQTRD